MKVVIEADEQYKTMLFEIANAISAKISIDEEDFYDDLPEFVKLGIEESREQIKQGEFYTFEEVKNNLLLRKHKVK